MISPRIYFNAADLAHSISGISPVELLSESIALSYEHYQVDKCSHFEGEFDI